MKDKRVYASYRTHSQGIPFAVIFRRVILRFADVSLEDKRP